MMWSPIRPVIDASCGVRRACRPSMRAAQDLGGSAVREFVPRDPARQRSKPASGLVRVGLFARCLVIADSVFCWGCWPADRAATEHGPQGRAQCRCSGPLGVPPP
jgi:hypothetical protein